MLEARKHMEILSRIIDIIKLPLKYIFWIALVSGVLLFLPETWLIALYVKRFSEQYGLFIGFVFLASISLTVINITCWVFNSLRNASTIKKFETQILDDIRDLSSHEKAVLREFFLKDRQTLRLPIDEPTVAGLIKRGILQSIGELAERSLAGMLMPVRITSIARNNLTSEMIDWPTEEPTKEQVQDLFQKRPDFARTLAHHERLFHRADPFI